MESKVEKKQSENSLKDSKEFKFFKKLAAVPYLLVLLALLMPLANVSCSLDESKTKPILEASVYELATGIDLDKALAPDASKQLHNMIDKNEATQKKLTAVMPNFPKMEPMTYLWGIAIAVLLAAAFAFISPLGSLTMGMLAMFSLWAMLMQLGGLCSSLGIPMLKVDPGVGIYAASALILIGSAMNLAVIIRPIVEEVKAKRATKKHS